MSVADNYRDLILKLLPPGKAWTRDQDSWAFKFAAAMGVEPSRIDGRVKDMLREIDPRYSTELLSDFEREYGLPDECSVIGNSPEQRRQDLIARITAYGGQSFAYFTEVMANAGTPITISMKSPFRVGSRIQQRLRGPGYRYIWFVDVPAGTLVYAVAGEAVTDDPIVQIVDDSNVICFLEKNKPAHTYIHYTFS